MEMFWICVLVTCLHASFSHFANDRFYGNDECDTLPGCHQCMKVTQCTTLVGDLVGRDRKPPICGMEDGVKMVCCSCTKAQQEPRISHISPTGCGIRQELDTDYRLSGADYATKPWPWVAALFVNMEDKPFEPICAGVLIDERHILTAAHCFDIYGSNPIDYSVIVGKNSLHLSLQKVPVEAIKIHESYNYNHFYNDIAILKLRYPPRYATPICLSEEISTNARDTYTVLGWGDFALGGPISLDLQEMPGISVMSNIQCHKKYENVFYLYNRNFYDGISNDFVCAGSNENKGFCLGNLGDPFLYQVPSSKTWYAVGVASFVHMCEEPGYPGVYTRVSSFIRWIENYVDSWKNYH